MIDLEKKHFDIYWLAGFYGAYLSKADITYIRGGEVVDFLTAMTAKNDYADAIYQPNSLNDLFQWFDIGIVLGGGAQKLINDKMVISCDIRMESGITDINDKDWRMCFKLKKWILFVSEQNPFKFYLSKFNDMSLLLLKSRTTNRTILTWRIK